MKKLQPNHYYMKNPKARQYGFTVVELVVVIIVIGVLAAISVFGFGAWRQSIVVAQVKTNLSGVASAMEDARNFDDGYPTTIPTSFIPDASVQLTGGGSADGSTFCIEATSVEITSIVYYIDSSTVDQGAQEGTCGARAYTERPAVTANALIAGVTNTSISLAWDAVAQAATYKVECALNSAFTTSVTRQSVTVPSATLNSLQANSPYFCRIQAVNVLGSGDWSAVLAVTTQETTCADLGQYGTYPNCYDYDSLPIASSVEGYWTTPPDGYLLENGEAISRTTYADLFAAIGTTFGAGDGVTTFNLPDSTGRVAVNRKASDVEFATLGQFWGAQQEALTVAQMPSHQHNSYGHSYAVDAGFASGRPTLTTIGATNFAIANSFQSTGGNAAHNNIQPSIVKNFAIKFRPATGSASALPAGTSIAGYWSAMPTGYLEENGSAISRSTYSALFSAIGTTYGSGDGSTTFTLPDSQGRAAVNISTTDTEFDSMGEKPGSKTEAVSLAQLPSHTHSSNGHSYANDAGFVSGRPLLITIGTTNFAVGNVVGATGGGQTHNNIQPSIVKRFAIKHAAVSGTVTPSPGTSLRGYWNSVPAGYLLEDGSAVSRFTYSALFSAIGTTYGAGDGSTTFNLPDSRGRLSVNRDVLDLSFDTLGEKRGAKTHTLTQAEMPSHSHSSIGHSYAVDAGFVSGRPLLSTQNAINFPVGNALVPAGGGQAHNEIQPSIVQMHVIKF